MVFWDYCLRWLLSLGIAITSLRGLGMFWTGVARTAAPASLASEGTLLWWRVQDTRLYRTDKVLFRFGSWFYCFIVFLISSNLFC